jgi:hypothetical protein
MTNGGPLIISLKSFFHNSRGLPSEWWVSETKSLDVATVYSCVLEKRMLLGADLVSDKGSQGEEGLGGSHRPSANRGIAKT